MYVSAMSVCSLDLVQGMSGTLECVCIELIYIIHLIMISNRKPSYLSLSLSLKSSYISLLTEWRDWSRLMVS